MISFSKELNNKIYHLFNPYSVNLATFFDAHPSSLVKVLQIEFFIDKICHYMLSSPHYDLVLKFLLHQGWLDEINLQNPTKVKFMQDKTEYILKQLGFKWMPITQEALLNYLTTCYKMEKCHVEMA